MSFSQAAGIDKAYTPNTVLTPPTVTSANFHPVYFESKQSGGKRKSRRMRNNRRKKSSRRRRSFSRNTSLKNYNKTIRNRSPRKMKLKNLFMNLPPL